MLFSASILVHSLGMEPRKEASSDSETRSYQCPLSYTLALTPCAKSFKNLHVPTLLYPASSQSLILCGKKGRKSRKLSSCAMITNTSAVASSAFISSRVLCASSGDTFIAGFSS